MSDRIKVTVEELRLRNFRGFANARLSLSDLTYLVGRNGAGKSSILDAVRLLREAVTDSLENAFDRRGGLLKVRRLAADADEHPRLGVALVFTLTFSGGQRGSAVYGFELVGHSDQPMYVVEERLVAPAGGFSRRDRDFEAPGRKIEAAPPVGNLVFPNQGRADSVWEAILEAIRQLQVYEISPAHMAVAPEVGDRTTLLSNGANAGDVVKALPRTADRQWLIDRLALVTDGLVDVRADALLGRRVLRFVQDQGGVRRELDASGVSQGTLRALGVLLALRQQPTPSLVLIDEIENSVHPSALSVLLDAAEASCDRTRVVLTSHSPEVLSHTSATGERVRVVDWRDGVSSVYCLNAETRAAVSEIETVGAMLSCNALWPAEEPEVCDNDLFALEESKA